VSVDGLYIEVIDVDDGRVGAARIRAD